MSVAESLVGQVGLAVIVLIHLAYTAYENRRGAVANFQSQMKALGVATYRLAQSMPDVDEERIRQEVMQNGGDSKVFPSDFDGDAADDEFRVKPGGGRDGRGGASDDD